MHNSDQNIHAMRLGPGKHLKGLTLFGGVVKPEEVSSLGATKRQYLLMLHFCPVVRLFS
jgi:hypothetical protein